MHHSFDIIQLKMKLMSSVTFTILIDKDGDGVSNDFQITGKKN